MKLATEIRWQDRRFAMPVERIRATERWGYDALFTAEGAGSDALTPLGYAAAITERLTLGTCIAQNTGRSPAALAMAFQTLAAMTGPGRVLAGLGSTNPVTAEAMHGRAWGSPYWRMRDYVAILRQAFRGESLAHDGREVSIPYPGPRVSSAAARTLALESTPDIPIILAAASPAMITLAAEVADGWFPVNFAPGMMASVRPLLAEGFRRAGGGKSLRDFAIWVHADVIVDDDVRAAMRPFKAYVATYAGLQREQMVWRGYGDLCAKLQELTAAGRFDEAIEAVPDEYVDDGWLVGPLPRIAERLRPWLDCGATGLIVRYGPQVGAERPTENIEAFRTIASACGRRAAD